MEDYWDADPNNGDERDPELVNEDREPTKGMPTRPPPRPPMIPVPEVESLGVLRDEGAEDASFGSRVPERGQETREDQTAHAKLEDQSFASD